MVFTSFTPIISNASASSPITLSLDNPHVVIQGGDSDNITLTISNDGQYITSYSIALETTDLSNSWTITSDRTVTEEVVPLSTATINLSVVLDSGAMPSDSGSFVINVSEDGGTIYNNITASVTVMPSYASSIGFSSANGPLQQMYAGTSANFTIDVNNDGNAEDTILLDVDAEPDLAGFWANYSNNSNGQGNNPTSSVNVPEDVLIYGNDFVSNHGVETILADIFNSVGTHNSTVAKTSGSFNMTEHWDLINTPGDSWNTTLRDGSHTWDFVVIHDQAQIPGLGQADNDFVSSLSSANLIADAVENEGSEIMLLMTWGYRAGDLLENPVLYNNYTEMQNRLEQGYIDYHDDLTTVNRDVFIAPVGLAFANLYEQVKDEGGQPEAIGNIFYDLYDGDGKQPSHKGSYLAACVLYASMTGNFSVASTDTISLPAEIKLQLQQAADDTVFNQTSHIEYPWQQSSSPSMQRNLRTIPAGWNLVFADQEISNIPALSSDQTTIRVAVPSDAAPGFYGFNLFSASTNGNTSSNYTFVIEVMPENDISYSFLDQASDFIPGQIHTSSVLVTNTGNSELELQWDMALVSGPCTVQLVDALTSGLSPGSSANVEFTIEVESSATAADECEISLDGEGHHGTYEYDADEYIFTIGIDELIAFELYSPSEGVINLVPQNPEQYTMRIYNNGSETVEFFLNVGDDSPLETSLVGATSVNVSANAVGQWSLSTTVMQGFVGAYSQDFTVSYNGISSSETVNFDVQPVADFSIDGPLDGRISTKPGESVDVDVSLSNTGTMDLDLTASVSGLPTGAEVTFSDTQVALNSGATFTVSMSVSMISSAQSGSYPIVVTYSDADYAESLSLELQVADSVKVNVTSAKSSVIAGPISAVTYTFEVTNLGSASDTFFVSLNFDDNNNASTWFDTVLSTTSVNLAPSSTQVVTISIRELSVGAPTNGCDVNIVVTSSNDDTVSGAKGFKIKPIEVGAEITIVASDDSAKPGETISGEVSVSNTGTGEDQFTLTIVNEGCDLSEIFSLPPATPQTFSWTCTIDENANAGSDDILFRVRSNARSDYFIESLQDFTIESNWANGAIIELSFADESLSMASSGGSITTIEVRNLANTPISGSIFIGGNDSSLFDCIIKPHGTELPDSSFNLANGQSTLFVLEINSKVSESEAAELTLNANITVDSTTYYQESENQLSVIIDGPELPPNGVELPLGVELDEQQSVNAIIGGWALVVVLLILMNILRKRRRAAPISATVEEVANQVEAAKAEKKPKKEKTVKAHKLKANECRMTPDNKVICPFCDAKLGVPRGSTPPFKFNCPQCEKKIRVVENQKF